MRFEKDMLRKIACLFTAYIYCISLSAQTTAGKPVVYCNPLVVGSIPKKALSLQLEIQSGFDNQVLSATHSGNQPQQQRISHVQGLRLGYNKNLVMKPRLYVSMDLGYWYSRFDVSNPGTDLFSQQLDKSAFHSFTASANIFKPLDQRHFLLLNVSAEFNGNGQSFRNGPGFSNLFAGGALIYGWKKGVSSMTGVGVIRAYRFGRVIHLPAFLMNRSFNKQWGIEMLLPARAAVRYAPNDKSLFTAGYDLEGGQFHFAAPGTAFNNRYWQRGEIRPRIGFERAVHKNWRISVTAGVRINGRLQLANKYDGAVLLVDNDPGTNFFGNAGIHLMTIKGKKKKKG